jgi:phospholipid/cholesterol/gamma-HCH transport system substrate-binding protein
MSYDGKYKLPTNVDAVLVPPSIVSDRYVQLAPVYTGGPVLPDHGVIPPARTEVPLELDQIFSEIDQLNVALGPGGANRQGALAHLINVSAANLAGNGQNMHDFIVHFSQLIQTLSSNRTEFFGTLANLEQFSRALAADDGGVRNFFADLSTVSGQLNGERQQLGLALKDLAIALGQVATFVHDNKAELTADISGLTTVTKGLVGQKRALEELIDQAPTGLVNLALTYDPATHVIRTRNASGGGSSTYPFNLFCSALLGGPCPAPPSAPTLTSAGPQLSIDQTLNALIGVAP